jgi:hypothetical protein
MRLLADLIREKKKRTVRVCVTQRIKKDSGTYIIPHVRLGSALVPQYNCLATVDIYEIEENTPPQHPEDEMTMSVAITS